MTTRRQGPPAPHPDPGKLRLVQAFVNTADRDAGRDQLANPRTLADWLARHGLLPAGTELDAADRQRALEVREAWRSVLAGSPSDQEIETLDRAMAAAPLYGRQEPDGRVRLEPAAGGLDGALGLLLAIVVRAQIDGRWQRLKICASPTCRAAFYDRSSNRSARWCRPRCGNRLSSRASKRRQRRAERRADEARRRARSPAPRHEPPSLSELENHPDLGRLARQIREREAQDAREREERR